MEVNGQLFHPAKKARANSLESEGYCGISTNWKISMVITNNTESFGFFDRA
jgi:hypothetical protein